MSLEQLIAVISLHRLIGLNKFKILKQDITKAIGFQGTLAKLVTKVISSESIDRNIPITLSEIASIREALLNLDIPNQLQIILSEIDSLDADSIELSNMIQSMLANLHGYLPQDALQDDSFLQLPPIETSKSKDIHLLWTARIAEDPLWVLKLMSDNMLTNMDVEALAILYPELYEIIVSEFISQIIDKFTINTSIPRRLKLQLGVLLQTPIVSVNTLLAYQEKDTEPATPADVRLEASEREAQ